jgi:hypothetical protein
MVQPFAKDHGAGAQDCAGRCCGHGKLHGGKPAEGSAYMAPVLRGRHLRDAT